MAQSYLDPNIGNMVIPDAYVLGKVATGSSGVATNGVVALVGEATMGADFSNEDSLEDQYFLSTDLGAVTAKYGSGPLVEAFRNIVSPSTDPQITGSVNAVYLIKTNEGASAYKAILDKLGAAYATFYARSAGSAGNLIYFTVSETAEVRPTTSSFTYIPPVGTLTQTLRVNGGAAVTASVTAAMTPTSYVSTVDGLSGIDATGGSDRLVINASRVSDASTLVVAASGNQITVTISTGWSVVPTAGDTLVISATSAVKGDSDQNVGGYVVTAATATTITAVKLSDASKGGAVAGVVTAPVPVVVPVDIASTTADLICYSPVTITGSSATEVLGIGKTLEINQTTTTEYVNYLLATTTVATWLSVSGAPVVITSASERSVTTTISRDSDAISDSFDAGGDIALKVGYTGTTASVVVTSTTMTFTVTGGAGASLGPLTLSDFPTISDLATYINSQTGYTAAYGSAALGQKSPTGLDEGTYNCGTTYGAQTCRIKMDAVSYYEAVRDNSSLVTLSDDQTPAAAGLPGNYSTTTFLAGGSKGSTTNSIYTDALAALENLDVNFIVPLFSRDATSDISDGLTDAASTYTIDHILSSTKTHCVDMCKPLNGKPRQACFGIRGSFQDARDTSGDLASHLVTLSFQDAKVTEASGTVQEKPWMTAVKAAGTQAAAFYQAIFNKSIDVSGFVTYDSSFNYNSKGDVTRALKSGLLVGKKTKSGFVFVSDQTTYQKDNNAIFNSMQAIYAKHLVEITLKDRVQKAVIGQSTADLSAAGIAGIISGIMFDLRRLKLISPSKGAPSGYKNVVVEVSAPVVQITLDVFLTTAYYFAPIVFNVSTVQQSASL